MDAIDELKKDVSEGRIDASRLVDALAALQRQLQAAKAELEKAKQRIGELEKQLGISKPAKIDEPFSMKSEAVTISFLFASHFPRRNFAAFRAS